MRHPRRTLKEEEIDGNQTGPVTAAGDFLQKAGA